MSEQSFQTMALWAAIVITVLGAFGTLIKLSLSGRVDTLERELEKAETRIKDNTKLANDSVSERVKETKEAHAKERAEDIKRIERLERNYDVNNEMEPRKRP